MRDLITCQCLSATDVGRDARGNAPLEAFIALRDRCPALKKILLPDNIWQEFVRWHQHRDKVADHSSAVLTAFIRGVLRRITSPVHRFLLAGDDIAPNARRQYVMDLRERWMFDTDPVIRNRLFRAFHGRYTELQIAEWLEDNRHVIVGMEATRRGPDIETTSTEGQTAFEVKVFGQSDDDFKILLRAMHAGPSGGGISVHAPVNYLLFRVYEAARQLRRATGQKTVVIVIDEIPWYGRFDAQITHDWVDWTNPQFLGHPSEWEPLLSLQKQPTGLPVDLGATIRELDRLLIFRQDHVFEFRLEKEISFDPEDTLKRGSQMSRGSPHAETDVRRSS